MCCLLCAFATVHLHYSPSLLVRLALLAGTLLSSCLGSCVGRPRHHYRGIGLAAVSYAWWCIWPTLNLLGSCIWPALQLYYSSVQVRLALRANQP